MDKFSELKAAAMAATPGPWSINRTGNTIVSNHSHPVATVSDAFHRQLAGGGVGKDAEFITAANPATVLALLAELEAKDDALRAIAFHVSAGGYNADSVDAEMFKQKIIDGINGISDVFVKRLAELEAIRAAAEKLVRCKGRYHSEQNYRALAALFGVTTPDLPPVDGDSEAVIAELRAKLATPVRLPRPACTYADHSYPAYSRKQVEEIITSAGMRFTVEGDE